MHVSCVNCQMHCNFLALNFLGLDGASPTRSYLAAIMVCPSVSALSSHHACGHAHLTNASMVHARRQWALLFSS